MDFVPFLGVLLLGKQAWQRGDLRRDNPYEPGSLPWKAWDRGWTEACAEGYGFRRDDET